MRKTPKKSFDNCKSLGKSTTKQGPSLPAGDVTSGRFIPHRLATSLRTVFNVAENTPPVDAKGVYSSMLQSQLFGHKLPHHSKHHIFRYHPQASAVSLEENKENKGFAPLSLPSEQEIVPQRAIPKVPFKVLDAPQLQDDFYLNVVDWGVSDALAVGLSSSIYLWSAQTGSVTHLDDQGTDIYSSLSWGPAGTHLAAGTSSGNVLLFDANKQKIVRHLPGHSGRVGSLSWNNWLLSSGSRDRSIIHRDLRTPNDFTARLSGHTQEVCGLKWSFDGEYLASGGNDNTLIVWSSHSVSPLVQYEEHTAAVKAIAWSPHQHGLLASGGGTADRTIRFWDIVSSQELKCVDTESQVCSLVFSKNYNELVSTHGYSQNQVNIWKCPSMTKLAALMGHTSRVLYLAMSPDSQTIVTGAGDETLRFWKVFPSSPPSPLGTCNLNPTLSELR